MKLETLEKANNIKQKLNDVQEIMRRLTSASVICCYNGAISTDLTPTVPLDDIKVSLMTKLKIKAANLITELEEL